MFCNHSRVARSRTLAPPGSIAVVILLLGTGCSSAAAPGVEKTATTKSALILPTGDAPQFSCGPNSTGATNSDNGDTSAPCIITRTQVDANTIKIRIDRPVVNQPSYQYPITFQAGDRVTISDAGGCAQTGGKGDTWKRYVDPQGDEAGSIYYGGISIPGAPDPLLGNLPLDDKRFLSVLGHTVVVPDITGLPCTGVSLPTNLTLTYKDENGEFYNNGYYSKDDGNGCDVLPDAYVELTIVQGVGAKSSDPMPPAADQFDVVTDGVVPGGLDCNLFPNDPRWGWQQPNADICPSDLLIPWLSDPGCVGALNNTTPQTHQPTEWDPAPFRDPITHPDVLFTAGLLCSHAPFELDLTGHRNWAEVTYNGTLRWDSWDEPFTGDDDYNIYLNTVTNAVVDASHDYALYSPVTIDGHNPGATAYNDAVKGEFDSDETVDRFDKDPSMNLWWTQFQQAVDPGSGTYYLTPGQMIDGHDAVMMGLLGIDTTHNASSEIHPVHALAVRTDSPGVGQNGTPLDRWAFFVRNSGDEGECSQFQHYVDLENLTLALRRPTGVPYTATAVMRTEDNSPAFTPVTHILQGDTPNVWYAAPSIAGQDFLINFTLGPAQNAGLYYGEIVLEWSQPPVPGTASSAAAPAPAPLSASSLAAGLEDDEPSELADFLSGLTPAQVNVFDKVVSDSLPPPLPIITQVATRGPDQYPVRPLAVPTVSTGPAPRLAAKQRAHVRGACVATRGGIDYPEAMTCPPVPPYAFVTASPPTTLSGCFFSPWSIALTGIDGSGAGLDRVEYSLDGGATFVGYTQPLTLSPGVAIRYRAVDKTGTVGPVKQYVVPTRANDALATASTLFANGTLDLRDVSVVGGTVQNGGTVLTQLGPDGVVGSIRSRASVQLRDRARVTGDLTTSGTVTPGNGSSVGGVTTEHAALTFADLSACVETFAGAGADVQLEPDQARSITPGTYGNVSIKSRAVLTIAPGVYRFQSLDLEPQARINISGTGAVSLLVNGSVIWRGTASGPLVLGIFNANTTYIESAFAGIILQPSGSVTARALSTPTITGQVFAQNITIDAHATVTPMYLFGTPVGGSSAAVATACDGLCPAPEVFSSGFDTISFGALGGCVASPTSLMGGACSGLVAGQSLLLNGEPLDCNGQAWAGVPAARNGGYCIQLSPNSTANAYVQTW